MKPYVYAWAMCQSMFCAIPFPWNLWDEKQRGKMLLFLPVIGLELGLIWAGLAWLCRFLGLHPLLRGLVVSVWPFAATGFIHLDGYMDVLDAVKSCRSLERRREILKDSHVGAFAVIGLGLLFLSQFALFSAAPEGADEKILIFLPVVSRCCSALAVTGLRPMSTSQYADQTKPMAHLIVLGGMLLVSILGGFLLCGKYGWVLPGCLAGYGLALRKGYRALEGMNGDISGYALTLGEVWGAAVFALI